MYKKTGGGFLFLAILVAGCLYVLTDAFTENPTDAKGRPLSEGALNPGIFKLSLGIDLDGGAELTYELDLSKLDPATIQDIGKDVKKVMEERLDQYGTSERTISLIGTSKLLVELPGADQLELNRVKIAISQAGELTFNLVHDDTDRPGKIERVEKKMATYDLALRRWVEDQKRPQAERTGLQKPPPLDEVVVIERVREKDNEDDPDIIPIPLKYVVRTDNQVEGKWLRGAYRTLDDTQQACIGFEFGNVGRTQFAELTGENVGKRLAIILDGEAVSVANINSQINGRGIIQGVDPDEIATVVPILKAGSLPTKPILVNETTIGSVLGDRNVAQGYAALMVSFLLVILFMAAFYLAPGLIADVSLILNLIILLAVMILFRNTLTFPGMAGLLLTIGMSVDANILILERIREERGRGKSLNQAVQAGYQRAFWTIFDANLTTLITAYILFQFGTGPVKGFAVVLSLGIVISFFTALFVSRLILSLLMRRKLITELRMLQLFKAPSFDFLQYRKPALVFSVAVIAIGLGVLLFRGSENLGIDFTGGHRLVIHLKSPVPEDEVRQRIASITMNGTKLFADIQVQRVGETTADGSSAYSVRTRTDDAQLKKAFGVADAQDPALPDPARTLPEDGPGTGGEEQQQFQPLEAFRAAVEEELADLLAPQPFGERQIGNPDAARLLVFTQSWRLQKEDGITAAEIQQVLTDKGFPVARVESVSDAATLGQNYVAFKITTKHVSLPDP